jgi:ArsR family transcriptional regulator
MKQGSETQEHDLEVEGAVKMLKALGHPIRLRILDVLANKAAFGFEDESCCGQAEVCVCKINELFEVSMPTISHHLKLLREAGLVTTRRDGVWIYYSLRREPLSRVAGMLSDLAARGE